VTLISFVGLTLGVLALVVVLALLEGFQSGIRAELVARTAHARVEPREGRRLEDPAGLASLLQAALPDAQIVQTVRGTCLVSADGDAVPASLVGRSDVSAASIDRVLAVRLAVASGDDVEVISARQRLTPMGPLPVRGRVHLQGVQAPEPGRESGSLIVPLATAQRILWGSPVVEAIELRDPADPWRLGRMVRDLLADRRPDVRVLGLEALHRPLLLALTLERVMIFAAVGLMLVVAALNLLCNVAMLAAEKRRDLAVLAGLGLAPVRLRRLFLVMGTAIGAIAAAVGSVAGAALAVGLDRTQALPLPRGVFVVSAVPFAVRPITVAVVIAFALGLSVLVSWLPARAVARREPAEGLRYE